MIDIINLTNEFILTNHLFARPLSFNTLITLCGEKGYAVFSYSQSQKLIAAMHLEEYTKNKAFTWIAGDSKIIFFDDNLSHSERLFALAHELGHIYLEHTYLGILGIDSNQEVANKQEVEANTFAYQLLAPICVLQERDIKNTKEITRETGLRDEYAKNVLDLITSYTTQAKFDKEVIKSFGIIPRKRIKVAKYIIGAFLFIGLLNYIDYCQDYQIKQQISNGQAGIVETQQPISLTPATIPQPNDDNNEKYCYITKTGNKYHKENCHIIQGKGNLTKLTIEEAEKANYEPCKFCFHK